MSQSAAPDPPADAARDAAKLEAATDQAIAACGGNARDAVKALIVANEYLEQEVCDLMQAVSKAFVRGRFKTYNG
jgi:stage V sporulation protein SpoVS